MALLGDLKPNFAHAFGSVSRSMSSRWMQAHFRRPRMNGQPQATVPAPERSVTHSERVFLGRADRNLRETVPLMCFLPNAQSPVCLGMSDLSSLLSLVLSVTAGRPGLPGPPSCPGCEAPYSPPHASVASLPRLCNPQTPNRAL